MNKGQNLMRHRQPPNDERARPTRQPAGADGTRAPRRRVACHDHRMSRHARSQRLALVEAMSAAGPDAPTLCEGWQVRDLAAHVVLRERRPDAALGVVLPPLSGWTSHVQAGLAGGDFEQLLDRVRTGPGRFSPFALPVLEELANVSEFFVHTEDVRRAGAGAAPRHLDPDLSAALWRNLTRGSRLMYRKVSTGLVLATPEGRQQVVRSGDGVRVTGEPGELLLHAFGRGGHAELQITGDPAAVHALAQTPLGA